MNINDAFNLLNISEKATQAEIKKAYKVACIKFHPDKNKGGTAIMQAINEAYNFLKSLGEKGTKTVEPTQGFKANNYGEEIQNVLNRLFELEGLIVEVCGNWIWISGDTKPHKDILGRKEGGIGCYWSKNKKQWYYRPAEFKSYNRQSHTMDQIRAKHGSSTPQKMTTYKIAS
ncbi:DnaJ domain-containing protein [Photobacterium makurazakiensis]|uniref:J domain-containing protein n=1 Tax=Photobacterium makurazakiensis TaxID=2910234 RepID=UPI003D0D7FA1